MTEAQATTKKIGRGCATMILRIFVAIIVFFVVVTAVGQCTSGGSGEAKKAQSAAPETPKPPLALKGVVIGQEIKPDDFQKQIEGTYCVKQHNGKTLCKGPMTVAGEKGELYSDLGTDNVVRAIQITMKPESFPIVAKELMAKYPGYKVESGTAQNKLGAKFENMKLSWNAPDRTYWQFEKYAGRLDESILFFGQLPPAEELKARQEKRSKDL